MSLPPTLIIGEADEDRTQLDPRPEVPTPARLAKGTNAKHSVGGASRALMGQWSLLRLVYVGSFVAVLLVLVSVAVAYNQWRAVESLEKAIAELEASRLPRSFPTSADHVAPSEPISTPVQRVSYLRGQTIEADERSLLELEGARLLASNDFRRALEHYLVLAERLPGEPVFGEIVEVLRTKLRCGVGCP